MKNKITKFSIFALLVLGLGVLNACAVFDKDKSLTAPQMWPVIDKNRANLKNLKIGMTKAEVLKVMGKPLTEEVYNTDNHWFYYTQTKWSDGRYTRDECTPLVFDVNGHLEGWGIEFYRTHYNYIGWTDKAIRQVLK